MDPFLIELSSTRSFVLLEIDCERVEVEDGIVKENIAVRQKAQLIL